MTAAGSTPWKALRRALTPADRKGLETTLRALLEWQKRLGRFPTSKSAPDATPFVTLYAPGRLVGCFGSTEGAPAERLARAFLRAVEDVRYGGVLPKDRAALTASVTYLRAVRRRSLRDVEDDFELGRHGLGAVAGASSAILLPSVAADEHAGLPELLEVLARKLGVGRAELARAALFTFETETVVARPPHVLAKTLSATDAAAAWLAARVASDGRVCFGVDARARTQHERGDFMHGRAAVVVQALAAHGGYPRSVSRARRWLQAEITAALAGKNVADWPAEPARVAGTVALAVLAGFPLHDALLKLAALEPVRQNAWHGAQVVAALGERAPESLFRRCVAQLETEPWAPWTALAARAKGDVRVATRVESALTASIRRRAPYAGTARVTAVPEIALTALTVEALARSRSSAARAAASRAAAFLRSAQFVAGAVPAALDAKLAGGAFPLSPLFDALRSDVTAHALLALLATE